MAVEVVVQITWGFFQRRFGGVDPRKRLVGLWGQGETAFCRGNGHDRKGQNEVKDNGVAKALVFHGWSPKCGEGALQSRGYTSGIGGCPDFEVLPPLLKSKGGRKGSF